MAFYDEDKVAIPSSPFCTTCHRGVATVTGKCLDCEAKSLAEMKQQQEAWVAAREARIAAEWAAGEEATVAHGRQVEVITDFERGLTKWVPLKKWLSEHPGARVFRERGKLVVRSRPGGLGLDIR